MVQAFGAWPQTTMAELDIWCRKELDDQRHERPSGGRRRRLLFPGPDPLDYAPRKFSRTVVLVGKGITFDSGGLNIKPGNSMEEMKCDMAGAAAVLAVMKTAARAAPAAESDRPGGRGRKHARPPRLQTRRHHHLRQQENRGDRQHRRRGQAGPGRRPDHGRPAKTRLHHRTLHPDRGHRHRPGRWAMPA